MDSFAKRYGPWALIAGASEGIGEAFARELAGRGLNLALVARRQELLEQTAHAIVRDTGVEVRCIQLDLGQEVAAATLAIELADVEVGLVVYNAALAPTGRFLQLTLAEQLSAVDVNVRGPLGVAHRFGARMAARGSGGIILLSSLTAFQGSPFVATYGGTKAFLLTLAEGLWYELAPSGIDVLAVCAGATRTPRYLKSAVGRAPGELEAEQVAREALARLGRGPLMIPGCFNRLASQLMRRLLPRRATIRIMGGQTRHLANRTD